MPVESRTKGGCWDTACTSQKAQRSCLLDAYKAEEDWEPLEGGVGKFDSE